VHRAGVLAPTSRVGTILYSAPEQLLGQQLDGRADQYALAATVFHLLTGKPPFEGSNPAVVISSHLSGGPPSMAADHRPELRQLDAVVSKAMSKDPNDRYRSCRDFAQALGEIAAGIQPSSPAMSVGGPAAPNQESGKATPVCGAYRLDRGVKLRVRGLTYSNPRSTSSTFGQRGADISHMSNAHGPTTDW